MIITIRASKSVFNQKINITIEPNSENQPVIQSILPQTSTAVLNTPTPKHTIQEIVDAMLLKANNKKASNIRKKNIIIKLLSEVGLSPKDDYSKLHDIKVIDRISSNISNIKDIKNGGKKTRLACIKELVTCACNMEPDIFSTKVVANLPRIKKDNPRTAKVHLPYEKDQLLHIFDPTHPFFKQNPDCFWVCMIGLFTGARANAALTIQYDEIINENGIDCIHFQSNHKAKQLKNQASERKVPIHLYGKTNWDVKPEVDLYLFHNEINHFIQSIRLHELGEYTQYFATLYFNHNYKPQKINSGRFHEFRELVDKIIFDNQIQEVSKLFYYDNGTRNTPYVGRRSYGMSREFKPAAGRITLTSILVKGILNEIACAEKGIIRNSKLSEPSIIHFYNVVLRNKKRQYLANYDILTGKTENGHVLDEKECLKIINLASEEVSLEGHKNPYWLKTATGSSSDLLDAQIQRDLKERYANENAKKFDADVDLIKLRATRQKSLLEQNLFRARQDVKMIRDLMSKASDRLEELKIQKQLNMKEKELKRKKEGLFLEQARIDIAAEDEIDLLRGIDGIEFDVYKIFEVVINRLTN